jgi:hypothetical protein
VDSEENPAALKTENTPTLKDFNESSDSLTMQSPESNKTPVRKEKTDFEAIKL